MGLKTIKNKVVRLVLSISLASILLLGAASGFEIRRIRQNTTDGLKGLNDQAAADATDALRTQKKEEIQAMAENKSSLADTSLNLILNQTNLVAMAAKEVYSNQEFYTHGQPDGELSVNAYDFSCNYPPETLGTFSYHLRAPRSLMDSSSIVEKDGTIVKARLDEARLTDKMRRELYLARYLENALGGIRNFDNGDGTYSGIGATYFCLESSGIDVLADTLTASMIEYDARESSWYQEAAKLKDGEVYWSHPIQDGSGRGIALICSMPVYVDGELVGVAGSGGLIENIQEMVQSTSIGESGYAFLLNTNSMNVIANANPDEDSEINRFRDNLLDTGNEELTAVMEKIREGESGITQAALDGKESYLAYSPLTTTSWVVVTVIGLDDASIVTPINDLQENISAITRRTTKDINEKIRLMAGLFVVIASVITVVIIFLSNKFARRLTQPIYTLTEGAGQISGGNLDYRIEVQSDDETALLGEAFNHMTDSLKDYIRNLSRVTAEKERIGTELDIARNIQASMLPCIFPAFPDRAEFDIYASMDPAKEVGGDFYDFFMVDERHLAIVVADVSGKGVPAALFMVIGKTLIKDHTKPGIDLGEVFTEVNELLCESNSEGLFITAFEGVLDLATGELRFVNAGHEIPYICKGNGYEPYKIRAGFVLAGMEGMRYQCGSMQLEPGDKIFQYTDGVTEATNQEMELYGMERLGEILCRNVDAEPQKLLESVKEDIDAFVGEALQFDDITMLCLEYKERMKVEE
jgi:sigma-B regulation protein RsbU (phosphoserine phosphatase)